jgi:membrane protein
MVRQLFGFIRECPGTPISGWREFTCLGWSDFIILAKSTYEGWLADRAPRLGAALAFYTLLSLAPIIIVVIAIASLAFGESAAEGRLMYEIQGLVGPQGAIAIQGLLKSARGPGSGTLATLLGLFTLFFGATGAVSELREALNTIWRLPPRQESSSWRSLLSLVRARAFSFAMVVGTGFLLLVSLIVNAWLSAAGRFFGSLLPTPEWVLQLAYSLFSFFVITALFSVLFKVMPDVKLRWSDVGVGAAVTSILFSVGKLLIGLYLGKTSFANTYGAAGSLVIVIVWVYYSAQIFFLGAEFTRVYTLRYGSMFRRQLELAPERPEAEVIEPKPRALNPEMIIMEGK